MSAPLIVGQGMLMPARGVDFDVSQGGGEGCAVILQDFKRGGDTPPNQWIVELCAQGREGWSQIGRVLTLPPRVNVEPTARIVAIGNCPGAKGWTVRLRGARLQEAYVQLISGDGVGSSRPGVVAAQPRPRVLFVGAGTVVTQFDTILLRLIASSDLASPGVWVQTFDKAQPPANGDIPKYSRFLAPGESFDQNFDEGDPQYTKGLSWAVSTTPGVLTIAATIISVTTVLG